MPRVDSQGCCIEKRGGDEKLEDRLKQGIKMCLQKLKKLIFPYMPPLGCFTTRKACSVTSFKFFPFDTLNSYR